MTSEGRYPEHDKLSAVKEESEAIGAFLDFGLAAQRLQVTPIRRRGEDYVSVPSINVILARYFDIDLDKIEAEKREMLDEIRKANA